MSNEKYNRLTNGDDVTTYVAVKAECEAKLEKLNKRVQSTANELEKISALYAKSVKEGLEKSKQIKELEDRIDQLEAQLKACQGKRTQLENQLKVCQDERIELENQLKVCQAKREELESQLKACQDKTKNVTELQEKLKN